MTHKLGICIPYRNRQQHLEALIPSLSQHLKNDGIDFHFYVGHQIDEKLFNRGAMKNIAAYQAFEDGCDYVAWHDVDMLPHNDCDYSYPTNTPIHIATKLSKYDYGMNYEQYFGGVVLFTKEQVERTNGYSNGYWDWGQEDDDLFWRCYYENYTNNTIFKPHKNKTVGIFNGETSRIFLPTNLEISKALNNDHTISILVKPDQHPEKTPIWLVGDPNRKFTEYPILRKDGSWTWGMSFNNSRAMSMVTFNKDNQIKYDWIKRFENIWTWVNFSYSEKDNKYQFYINDDLYTNTGVIKRGLKIHDSIRPLILGFCNHTNTYFKGKIGEIKIYNKAYSNVYVEANERDLVLRYDFTDNENIEIKDVIFEKEDVEVAKTTLPFRRDGSFFCLPHIDEGFVDGKWAKGETTSRNEKRLVTEMQQRKIEYKSDGIRNILDCLDIENIDNDTYYNTTIINVKMK